MDFNEIKNLLSLHISDNVYGLYNMYTKDGKSLNFVSFFKIKIDNLSRDSELGNAFLRSVLSKNETPYKSEAELALSITERLIGSSNLNKNSTKSNLEYSYSLCKKLYIDTMKDLSDIYCNSIDKKTDGVEESVNKFIKSKVNLYFDNLIEKYQPSFERDYKTMYEELYEKYNQLLATQYEPEVNNVFSSI